MSQSFVTSEKFYLFAFPQEPHIAFTYAVVGSNLDVTKFMHQKVACRNRPQGLLNLLQ